MTTNLINAWTHLSLGLCLLKGSKKTMLCISKDKETRRCLSQKRLKRKMVGATTGHFRHSPRETLRNKLMMNQAPRFKHFRIQAAAKSSGTQRMGTNHPALQCLVMSSNLSKSLPRPKAVSRRRINIIQSQKTQITLLKSKKPKKMSCASPTIKAIMKKPKARQSMRIRTITRCSTHTWHKLLNRNC